MTVVFIGPTPSHEPSHRVRGTGVYAKNLVSALGNYYPENRYIFSSSQSIPSDITHFLYFEPFFRTLPILKRCKTVVTVHDLTPLVFPQNFPAGVRGSFKWQLQKIALKNADLIITDSMSSKKDIQKFTGIDDKKINVIYLAAGEAFKIIEKNKARISLKKYNLPDKFALYVGDATWNKNLIRLLKAARMAQIPLVMTGKALIDKDFDEKNPWNKDLSEFQKLSLGDKNIILLGFVSEKDLINLYNVATVFIMPSLYEGFSLPVLEAMSCGCPVVTSKEGSIPEVVGDAAYYVDAYSVESISSGLKKVVLDENLQNKLSKKGVEQARKFSWQKTANQTMEIYKEVTGL